MSKRIVINNTYVKQGQTKEIRLHIARLPTYTDIDIPIYISRGAKPGPVLLLTAAIHGDEVNGVEIIRRIRENNIIEPLKGTVIAIPIVNIYGFLQQSRYLPDGRDLNRSFPGNKTGSLANLIAYTLMTEIVPLIDYGIDFHTGSANKSNYPQIRCNLHNPANKQLAEIFAPPFIVDALQRNKSFRAEICKLKLPFLVYEAGEALRFDEKSIQTGIEGTLRIMHHLGMINQSPKADKSIWISNSRWIRANHGGLFRSNAKLGEKVIKKNTIASITDPYGDFTHKMKTTETGYIIGINQQPIVHKGDALIHLGFE